MPKDYENKPYQDEGVWYHQDDVKPAIRFAITVAGSLGIVIGILLMLALSLLQEESMNKRKLSIVVRTDLGMTCGKMIAQAGHAIALAVSRTDDDEWWTTGMKKVTLAVDSEDELRLIYEKAILLGLHAHLVTDAGLTQNEPGTITCCAIGPGSEQELKKVTGRLKLFPQEAKMDWSKYNGMDRFTYWACGALLGFLGGVVCTILWFMEMVKDLQ